MIELIDINGKIWWVNPTAIAAVTACDEYGREMGFQRIETRTYIYMGQLKNVISMAEPPEDVLRMLRVFENAEVAPWHAVDMFANEASDADTVTMPPGGRRHQ